MAVELFVPGTHPTPTTYQVPGNQQIKPESMCALFDGTNAGGAWLACCSIYSQAGHLIGRAHVDDVFAAGDKAQVAFGPFFRSGQGAAAATAPIFAGFGNLAQTNIPSGVSTAAVLDPNDFYTNTPSVFAAAGNGIQIKAQGFYIAMWSLNITDNPGFRVANPQNYVITSGEGGNHWDVSGFVYNSFSSPGYQNGAFAEWDVSWTTTAGVPASAVPQTVVISGVFQATGQTLAAYAGLHIQQLGTDPLQFNF